jgi:hypothetical protein
MQLEDGYQIAKTLRSLADAQQIKLIPIIAIVSQYDPDRCWAAGVTGQLRKPISRNALEMVLMTVNSDAPLLAPDNGRGRGFQMNELRDITPSSCDTHYNQKRNDKS